MTAAIALVVVVLVACTGLLAASETVLTRMTVVRALRLDEHGARGARPLLWLVEHPARGLKVILLLTIVTRVTAAAVLTTLALRAGPSVVVAAVALLAVTCFVLAEVAPRTYTLHDLERVGLVVAPAVAWLARALQPLVRLLVLAGGAVARRPATDPFSSDEELRRLMGPSDVPQQAEIEDDERRMIHSIFELGDTVCREIMVPRPDMVTAALDGPLDAVVHTIVERGYSRIPVWRGERDHIVGVVYAKDVLRRLAEGGPTGTWDDLLRPATFVPESKRADELLRELQREKVHLAVVVDEHGATVGLVTIEDILEEIVGEIVDEFDHEEPPVVRLDERRLRVTARLTVHDLNELLGAELPEEEGWDTVGGLIIGLLGRVPAPGDAVQTGGVRFVAERVQGRRVSTVLVTPAEERDAVEAS
ncbi:MAG TPA: hemolysin family protein [Nitriliruptorales bacterium]|nr:hemolysin family protein [Nitriliruptorales bacterium]